MRKKIPNVNTPFMVLFILSSLFISIQIQEVNAVLPNESDDRNLRLQIPSELDGFLNRKQQTEETEQYLDSLDDLRLDVSGAPRNPQTNPQPTTDVVSDENIDSVLNSLVFNSQFGNLVKLITQVIHGACTQYGVGIVKKGNNSCVDGISPVVGAAHGPKTVQHLKNSTGVVNRPGSAYHQTLQCVGCAIAMAEANGKPYNAWGNAVNHSDQKVNGYQYVRSASLTPAQRAKIIPGSIFVSKSGTYGHVGIVVKVDVNSAGEAYSFVAQECNWSKPGYFGLGRTIAFDMVDGFQIPL